MAALQPFRAVGLSLNSPKFHRLLTYHEVAGTIRSYGGYRHVSTDGFEAAHKDLKRVMPRLVVWFILVLSRISAWKNSVCRSLLVVVQEQPD